MIAVAKDGKRFSLSLGALGERAGVRIRRKEISRFDSLNRNGKRQRTGAVQDANALSGAPRPRDSVVECASPLALFHRLTDARFMARPSEPDFV